MPRCLVGALRIDSDNRELWEIGDAGDHRLDCRGRRGSSLTISASLDEAQLVNDKRSHRSGDPLGSWLQDEGASSPSRHMRSSWASGEAGASSTSGFLPGFRPEEKQDHHLVVAAISRDGVMEIEHCSDRGRPSAVGGQQFSEFRFAPIKAHVARAMQTCQSRWIEAISLGNRSPAIGTSAPVVGADLSTGFEKRLVHVIGHAASEFRHARLRRAGDLRSDPARRHRQDLGGVAGISRHSANRRR